jgi:nicotinamide mononucleotide transporter
MRLGLSTDKKGKTMSLSNIVPRKEQSLGTHLFQGTALGVLLTALSYAVGLHFGWLDALNWLEVFAVFTSYLCTFLCVVERRINYPIGAISNVAYCVLFAQWGLVGSAFVTGYLTFSLLYGWFRWRDDTNTRPVTHLAVDWWIPVYVTIAAIAFVGALFLYPAFDQPVIWTDALILVGSVIAQLMLDNKIIENWVVWAVVNVFAIYTYIHAGLALAAFQYVFFLANTVYGYVMWRKAMYDGYRNGIETQAQLVGVSDIPDSNDFSVEFQKVPV